MQQRIEWIDIAKGIGMLMVIAGHTISLRYCYPLYAFHMPLFFFLSGLVFKDKNEGLWSYIGRITNNLLKPWCVMLFISFLVCLLIPDWREQLSLKSIAADLYTANTNIFQNSSLWYLICFYFVLIMFYFVDKIKRTYFTISLFILFAIAILWIKKTLCVLPLPFHRLPFKIDSALIALVFFSIAYWNKNFFLKIYTKKIKIILLVLLLAVTMLFAFFNGWSNVNSLDFGKIKLLYYIIAMMGISVTCMLSQWLSSSRLYWFKNILIFYGKNSLLIFGFQSLFIRLYMYIINTFQDNELALKMYEFTSYHQIVSFFIVSFVTSPMVVIFFQYLKKRNINLLK